MSNKKGIIRIKNTEIKVREIKEKEIIDTKMLDGKIKAPEWTEDYKLYKINS